MRSSPNGKTVVRAAQRADIHKIAELHQRSFTGFFLTQLGIPFLFRYYSIVQEYNKGILLLSENPKGKIIGFVAGFLDPDGFYFFMKKKRLALALALLPSLLLKPSILLRILSTYHNMVAPESEKKPIDHMWCELSSIAIDPDQSDKGIGTELANTFIGVAEKLGATLVYLSTDAVGNDRINTFYQKIGFILHSVSTKYNGRKMNEYRIILHDLHEV